MSSSPCCAGWSSTTEPPEPRRCPADDVRAAYPELKGRGVEFVEEPEPRPYGIDSAFRDPSGNHLRLTQLVDAPVT